MNHFLDACPPGERARILERTREVHARLADWAKPYGIFPPVRFPAIAISMAAAAPWLGAGPLVEMAMIPTWIYAIDDAFDQRVFTAVERAPRVARYAAIAAGRLRPPAGDAYASALEELTARLAAYPQWRACSGDWAANCRRMLAGMAFECDVADRIRAGGAAPSLRTYLQHGLHSIGVPLYLTGAWVIDSCPEADAHLEALRRLARAAGRAVRLANDLRTHEKEAGEGNLNAIMLLRRTEPEAAARSVQRRLRAAMRRLLASEGANLPIRSAEMVLRVTRFAVDLYADHDYHTIPPERILAP